MMNGESETANNIVGGIRGTDGDNVLKWFILSAGLILAITGTAKGWTSFGNGKMLAVTDPILGIEFGRLMLVVGLAEIVTALICLFGKRPTLAAILVAVGHKLCGVSPRSLVDGLETSMRLSRQPHGRDPYFPSSCG